MWTKLCGAFLLYTLAGCAGTPPARALADGSYRLQPTESVAIGGGASVRYDSFTDSRCPTNAQCIWAGKVSYHFVLTSPSGTQAFALDYAGQQVEATQVSGVPGVRGVRFSISFEGVSTLPVEQRAVVLEVKTVAGQ